MTGKSALARLAGLLYLSLAVCGGWAELAVRSGIRVPGEAAATAAHVVEQASLMRLAFAADPVNGYHVAQIFFALWLLLELDAVLRVAGRARGSAVPLLDAGDGREERSGIATAGTQLTLQRITNNVNSVRLRSRMEKRGLLQRKR
jgi:hypothetical protein